MVRVYKMKCYFCEDRFPEEYTDRIRHKTGGSYNRAPGYRPVRACYRCIASEDYRLTFAHAGSGEALVAKMARRGWVLGEGYYDHGYGWAYFREVLWPCESHGPTDPSTIPKRLLPPPEPT